MPRRSARCAARRKDGNAREIPDNAVRRLGARRRDAGLRADARGEVQVTLVTVCRCKMNVAATRQRPATDTTKDEFAMPAKSTPAQFWDKVLKTDTCWLWQGKLNGSGYGSFANVGAHRYSYALHFGAIPKTLYVCHHCDVRQCVRPDHLFLGTPRDNALDCSAKGRANGEARAHHGEDHGRAKLNWEIVREIRRRHPRPPGRNGNRQGPFLLDTAKEFGVSSGLLSQVVSGRIWPEEVMPNV